MSEPTADNAAVATPVVTPSAPLKAAQTPLYDQTQIHDYFHAWADGSFEEEATLKLRALTDDEFVRYISTTVVEFVREDGKLLDSDTEAETQNRFAEYFGYACANAPQELPAVEKQVVLLATIFDTKWKRGLYRRGDTNAPKPGETAVLGDVWNGQDAKGKDVRQATRIIFRTPDADDRERYKKLTVREDDFENDGRRVTSRITVNAQQLHKLLFGSELDKWKPLYLACEGYAGDKPPLYHLEQAIEQVFSRPSMGKSKKPQSAQS